MADPLTFFATCAPGLETVLHREVRALHVGRIEQQVGGVCFAGSLLDAWRANLCLRTAIRVLWRLARFPAEDAAALYRGVQGIDWRRFVTEDGTLVVDAQTRESAIDHSQFLAQRVKDAIVDQLRASSGRRPSVDKEDPDLRVHVHLWRDRATVSADTSGDSLHKRGWRCYQGRAPLAETTAAGLLGLSGWDQRAPLLDPFCGSGTILVEAALLALNVAPGLERTFGFERWPGHDAPELAALRERLRAMARRPGKLILRGSELDREHVAGALDNLASAGLAGVAEIEAGDGLEQRPRAGWNGWVVTNPPWGERLRAGSALHQRLGGWLRERCAGYHAAVLCGDEAMAGALALPGARRWPLLSGGVECEALTARLA